MISGGKTSFVFMESYVSISKCEFLSNSAVVLKIYLILPNIIVKRIKPMDNHKIMIVEIIHLLILKDFIISKWFRSK